MTFDVFFEKKNGVALDVKWILIYELGKIFKLVPIILGFKVYSCFDDPRQF